MSSLAKELFDSLKAGALAIAPGLKNLGADLAAEFDHQQKLTRQGLAKALFEGHSAFVLYEQGQHDNTPERTTEHAPEVTQEHTHEMEHDR